MLISSNSLTDECLVCWDITCQYLIEFLGDGIGWPASVRLLVGVGFCVVLDISVGIAKENFGP